MKIFTVFPATPYQCGELGSFGKASYMLLRQFNFPEEYYTEKDVLLSADHDRCFQWDHEHTRRCFSEHTGTGELGLSDCLKNMSDEQILAFLKDILKADKNIEWTGYRILGTVNRSNGYPVWTLELFSKHKDSKIKLNAA